MYGWRRTASFLLSAGSFISFLGVLAICIWKSLYEFHHHAALLFLWLVGLVPGLLIPLFTSARYWYLLLFVVSFILSSMSYSMSRVRHYRH